MAELRYAFPRTIPVMVGYLFLGMAYGILMSINGFGPIWSVVLGLVVFGGSLQYVGVEMLSSLTGPLTALLMSLVISARHLFYGISMLGKYGEVKKGKPYLIFTLSDETFSVLVHEEVPEDLNRDRVYLFVSMLDQCYWLVGSAIGGILGNIITFDTTGLDFALTALFVVIFVDQWKQKEGHFPALLGLVATAASLLLVGQTYFLIVSMVLIFAVLGFCYKRERNKEKNE